MPRGRLRSRAASEAPANERREEEINVEAASNSVSRQELTNILEEFQGRLLTEVSSQISTQISATAARWTDSLQTFSDGLAEKLQASLTRFESRLQQVESTSGPSTRLARNEQNNLPNDNLNLPNVDERPNLHVATDFKPQQIYFDGKQSWTEFYAQFLSIASLSNWNEKTKTIALLNSLRGTAISVLSSLTKDERQDFNKLCAALERRFGHAHLVNLYHSQFQNYKQKFDQDLSTLAAEIERLGLLALSDCPNEIRERLMTSRFIEALKDSRLQRDLRLAGPLGFHSTVARAVEIQAINDLAFSNRNIYFNKGIRKDSSVDVRKSWQSLTKKEFQPAKRNVNECWGCGETGHIRSNCPKESTNPNKKRAPNRTTVGNGKPSM